LDLPSIVLDWALGSKLAAFILPIVLVNQLHGSSDSNGFSRMISGLVRVRTEDLDFILCAIIIPIVRVTASSSPCRLSGHGAASPSTLLDARIIIHGDDARVDSGVNNAEAK